MWKALQDQMEPLGLLSDPAGPAHFLWGESLQGSELGGCGVHWGARHITGKEESNVSWTKFPSLPLPNPFLLQLEELLRSLPKYLFIQKLIHVFKKFQSHLYVG